MNITFTEDEIERYGRQILLPEIGGTGQARLRASTVLVVGAGGLGSPLLLYLAAAGVGTIGVVDGDCVALSNLHRQIAYGMAQIGRNKARAARRAMRAINPEVCVRSHAFRLTAPRARALIESYDLVCDGSDNAETRFLLADSCLEARRTLVTAAVRGFEGQISTFKPHTRATHPDTPCYRCLYPEPPPPDPAARCSDSGVLGGVTGVMGALQATEVIKELLGIGESLSGRLLLWNALSGRFRMIQLPRDPDCAFCQHL